jgi:hypothetical protein
VYGELAYQLDKPVGTSFGDVEFYLALLLGESRVWTFEATRD